MFGHAVSDAGVVEPTATDSLADAHSNARAERSFRRLILGAPAAPPVLQPRAPTWWMVAAIAVIALLLAGAQVLLSVGAAVGLSPTAPWLLGLGIVTYLASCASFNGVGDDLVFNPAASIAVAGVVVSGGDAVVVLAAVMGMLVFDLRNPTWCAGIAGAAYNAAHLAADLAVTALVVSATWSQGVAVAALAGGAAYVIANHLTLLPALGWQALSPRAAAGVLGPLMQRPEQSLVQVAMHAAAALALSVAPWIGLVALQGLVWSAWVGERFRADLAMTRHRLRHDPVTGLPNALGLEDVLTAELDAADRYGHDVAVVIISFDAPVESLDRLVGDAAAAIARALPDNAVACRPEQQGLAIAVPALERPEVARRASQLLEQARAAVSGSGVGVVAAVSFARAPDDAQDLLLRATLAVTRAQAEGAAEPVVHEDLRWRVSEQVMRLASDLGDDHGTHARELQELAALARRCGRESVALDLESRAALVRTAHGDATLVEQLARGVLRSGDSLGAARARAAHALALVAPDDELLRTVRLDGAGVEVQRARAVLLAVHGETGRAAERVLAALDADLLAPHDALDVLRACVRDGRADLVAAIASGDGGAPDTDDVATLRDRELAAHRSAATDAGASLARVAAAWRDVGARRDAALTFECAAHATGDADERNERAAQAVDLLRHCGLRSQADLVERALRGEDGVPGAGRAGIPAADRALLRELVTVRRVERGATVRRPGRGDAQVWVVDSGRVREYVPRPDGSEHVIGIHGQGSLVGADALADGATERWIDAVEPSVLLGIPVERLDEVLRRAPGVGRRILELAGRAADDATRRASEIAQWPARRRLAKLLLELADQHGHPTLQGGTIINVAIPQADLAERIGSGRRAVVRAMTEFRAQEILRMKGRRIELLDVEALGRLVDDGDVGESGSTAA
jgi:CRP/FNR family transcriptional regulator, cyclic AMP receptor protein